jgi:hypothetical protein
MKTIMPFKPNYHQERASRDRAKNAKKQEKLRKREQAAAERKARASASGTEQTRAPDDQLQ